MTTANKDTTTPKITYAARSYHKKKAAGICTTPGCHAPARPNRTHCQPCMNRMTAKTKRWQAKHKEEGLCVCCEQPAKEERLMCQKHIDLHNASARKKYKKKREKGKCFACENPSTKSYCSACMALLVTTARTRREKYKDEGLCTVCGKRPKDTTLLCSACHDKSKEAYIKGLPKKVEYVRKRSAEKRKKGICLRCKKPAVPDKTMCQKHLDWCRDKEREYTLKKGETP